MSQAKRVPTPPQLRAMLAACPTADLRARGALEFLRAYTSSDTGFIYLHTPEGLSLAAATSGVEPPAGLSEEVVRLWNSERDTADDADETIDFAELEAMCQGAAGPYWVDAEGTRFYRFLLHTHHRGTWVALGVVALRWRRDETLPLVGRRHLDAICIALLEAGDVAEGDSAGGG